VSFYVDWALLEGNPGTFTAEGVFDFDPFFEAATQAGIYLLAVSDIFGAMNWAQYKLIGGSDLVRISMLKLQEAASLAGCSVFGVSFGLRRLTT